MGGMTSLARRLLAGTALLAAAVTAMHAPARADGEPTHFLTMPDSFIRTAASLARDNLSRAKLPDGRLVGSETDAEKARSLIPFSDAREVVNAGAASGFAEWCGVEWDVRSFQPLMFRQRDGRDRPPKTLAYIALLHGVAQGLVRNDIARAGPCTEEDRAAIDDYLNRVAGK